MKYLLILLLLAESVIARSGRLDDPGYLRLIKAKTSDSSLVNGLFAYWKLDETSATRYDSFSTNTLYPNDFDLPYGTGKMEFCVQLDTNVSSNIGTLVATNFDMNLSSSFTVSVWVKFNSFDQVYTDWEMIYGMPDLVTFVPGQFRMQFYQPTKQLWVTSQSEEYLILDTADGVNEFATNTWYHSVVTFNATNGLCKHYINGVEQGQLTFAINSNTKRSFVLQGTHDNVNFPPLPLEGSTDEIGVWSRILTDEEITALYNSGAGKTYPF